VLSWWTRKSDSIKAAIIGAAVALIGTIVAAAIGVAGLVDNKRARSAGPASPSASRAVDPFVADPELATFAARYRGSVSECARPDPVTYEREVGLPPPSERQVNDMIRCYSTDRWAVYFINFFNSDTRWFLYDALFTNRSYQGNCAGWGPKQAQTSRPDGQLANVRLCFAANFKDGLGIYWEPAQDGAYERKYAGILLTRGVTDDALQKIWDEHTAS
jgi:hypothetical protein